MSYTIVDTNEALYTARITSLIPIFDYLVMAGAPNSLQRQVFLKQAFAHRVTQRINDMNASPNSLIYRLMADDVFSDIVNTSVRKALLSLSNKNITFTQGIANTYSLHNTFVVDNLGQQQNGTGQVVWQYTNTPAMLGISVNYTTGELSYDGAIQPIIVPTIYTIAISAVDGYGQFDSAVVNITLNP